MTKFLKSKIKKFLNKSTHNMNHNIPANMAYG